MSGTFADSSYQSGQMAAENVLTARLPISRLEVCRYVDWLGRCASVVPVMAGLPRTGCFALPWNPGLVRDE
jgi:hypothetical protein